MSSTDGLTIANLVDVLTAAGATTVLIDGRSGAGKSTLADALCERWESSVIVRLEDIYPGWDGLDRASEHVPAHLLQPRASGRDGRWHRWDWVANAPAEWHSVTAGQRLIVEGVGALHPDSRAVADLGIWVDAADDVRKERALRRDGETFRPHWDRWAAQEDVYLARWAPRDGADYLATDSGEPPTWRFAHVLR